ncbi:HD-GYP domain-containing protein [Ideonella sp. A 288]|uniref:HD-GYP domain-containing protein n=1 Tax=Ideonella sp. A 288 TaxID=1962181 RepID=UPI000B4B3E72|nr:hypothetical protein [Ideonella sp. A 288]
MNLIPFSKQYLRLNESLPFGVRDASGRLLLAAGVRLDRPETLVELQAADLYADEVESSEWRRRLNGAMDAMIRQNVSLQRISEARPEIEQERSTARELGFFEQWHELALVLDSALRDMRPDTAWMTRLMAVRERVLRFAERKLDASLYHLIFQAGHSTERYSSNHGLLCMLIARETARTLGWGDAEVTSLEQAALTMNVSMRRLQDTLASGDPRITAEMRAEIDAHAARSAEMLAAAGVADPVWIETVRLHHDDSRRQVPLASLDGTQRSARVLRRVDVFAAKLSRRATRIPMSPVQAAREACLGADGSPDEIGAALLKSVGLYPPGSFVELSNGEVGIVIARGRRANLPVVASLVSTSGAPLGVPAVRDTLDKRYAVKCAVGGHAVKVRPPHEQLLALR